MTFLVADARRACALAFLFAACATSGERNLEVGEIAAQHEHERELFQRAQAEFASRQRLPRTLDFGRDGSITLLECELQGRPEHEELRVLFTFVNTTERSLQGARVTVTLGDPGSAAEYEQELRLTLPIPTRFEPECTYTTAMYVPLRGLHLKPNWSWKIVPTAWAEGEPRWR
jgi:hypothetical protein